MSLGAAVSSAWDSPGGYYTGTIHEVVYCDTELTGGELAELEAYLTDKWGIA